MDNVDTVGSCVLRFTQLSAEKVPPKLHTPPESMDQENISECTVELGERCDPQLVHDLQRGARAHFEQCYRGQSSFQRVL